VYLRLASNGDIDRSFGHDGLYRSQTDGSPPVVEGLSDGALATGAEPGAPGEVPDLVLYRFPGEERP
jgi:hypothetical protein